MVECDRHWFLTWTMYGTWLPGDTRGFVSNVRDGDGPEIRHNKPETDYDADIPGIERAAQEALAGPPVRVTKEQAEALFEQFRETGSVRGWQLFAVAIMANHCHIVVGVPGDPEPATLLQAFKSYGSRKLNKLWGRPVNGTWWTESGSKRKLANSQSVLTAIRYVMEQEFPLLIWTAAVPELNLKEGRIT